MNLVTVAAFELRRYIYSSRIIVLLLVSTIPTLFYLQFAAREALTIAAIEEIDVPRYLLGVLVYFSHFIGTLVAILVVSDIVAGERSFDLLLASPTSRTAILGGKTIATILIVVLTIVLCFISSSLVFLALTELPSVEWQFRAFLLTVLLILFPLAVSLVFSVGALLIRDLSPSTAVYLPLFLFFVVPFIIWTSVLLRFFQFEITDYTYLGWVDRILGYEFKLSPTTTTKEQYEFALLLICSLTIGCFLIALLLFQRLESFIR
ncbi:MAG: ABC transporter permease [Candidatus Hodarchaeales archaeon]|jgi:ABC-type transport system involved in multi-copper enzyme maturation permease subunit